MSKTISHHRKYTQHTTRQSHPWTFTSEKRKAFIYTKSSRFLYKCLLSLGLNEELGPSLRTRGRAEQIRTLARKWKPMHPCNPSPVRVGQGLSAWQPSSRFSKTLSHRTKKNKNVSPPSALRMCAHAHIPHTTGERLNKLSYHYTAFWKWQNHRAREQAARSQGLSQGVWEGRTLVTQVFYLHCSGYINFYMRKKWHKIIHTYIISVGLRIIKITNLVVLLTIKYHVNFLGLATSKMSRWRKHSILPHPPWHGPHGDHGCFTKFQHSNIADHPSPAPLYFYF